MSTQRIQATRTINASPNEIFAVLADPRRHREIEGSGQVLDPVNPAPLGRTGQQFRMNMYAEQGPTGGAYRMDNTVTVFEPNVAIAWHPALAEEDKLPSWPVADMTGWEWRYDLDPAQNGTRVTLTYDWSAVPEHYDFPFPPFPATILDDSLAHLAAIVEQ